MTLFATSNKVDDQGKLPTEWDVELAEYDNVVFDVSSETTNPRGLTFKSDGTAMFILNNTPNNVFQYSLSSAWDISTASYDSVSFDVGSEAVAARSIAFKSDGTAMFIADDNTNSVYQYSLSSAWDVSSASYDSVSFDVSSEAGTPESLAFKPDGTAMFVLNNTSDNVFQYSLSSAWDISTASFDAAGFDPSINETTTPQSIAFKSDGTAMFIADDNTNSVYQYSLSSAWDVSSASYDSVSFDVSSEAGTPESLAFKPDGTAMFVLNNTPDNVFQYTLSSGEGDMLLTNLTKMQPTNVWRINDLNNVFFEYRFDAAETIDLVALLFHNGTNSGTIRIRAANTRNNLTSSPDFDSGQLSLVSDTNNINTITNDNSHERNHFIHEVTTTENHQWWRIDVSDGSNPDGYFEAGRLYLDEAFSPSRQLRYEWSITLKDGQERTISRGGQTYPRQRDIVKQLNGTISWNNKSEFWDGFFTLQRLQGTTKDVLVLVDEDDSDRLMDWTIYGLFTDLSETTHASYNIWEADLTVRELI